VTSRRTSEFLQLYRGLPRQVQAATRKTYQIFRDNPAHPGLRLERLKSDPRTWSVRITRDYRAVALRIGDNWLWFWIGTHNEFDRKFPA
jgi:hypothetical protein